MSLSAVFTSAKASQRVGKTLVLVALILLVSACGQKGPLKMPEPSESEPAAEG